MWHKLKNAIIPLLGLFFTTAAYAGNMTIEEKVGQLLMVHFQGTAANDDAKALIRDAKVGGFIYYEWANSLQSPEQVFKLSAGLQELARQEKMPALFISVDNEGGVVNRLKKGFTIFPGNRAVGETGDLQLAEMAALAMGEELQAVGINMNLAPVVDVNTNPKNPIIGLRAFSDRPDIVAACGKATLKGYKRVGTIAVLKHFPGHGDVQTDSHEDLPFLSKTMDQLTQEELLPFALLASDAEVIMTAHLLVPAFDKDNCSTLSERTLSYLRRKLGFKGVIITDSLVMEGVLKSAQTPDEAAIRALNAGCDIILLGGKQITGKNANFELKVADVKRIHAAIVDAVKRGRIQESRINEALDRVMKLKERRLATVNLDPSAIKMRVNTAEHQNLAQKIANSALKEEAKESNRIRSLREKQIFVVAPDMFRDSLPNAELQKLGKSATALFFKDLHASKEDKESAQRSANSADLVIVYSYRAWKHPSQASLIQSLLSTGKPVIVVAQEPADAALFSKADLLLTTYSPTKPSLQAVFNRLKKRY